MSTVILVIHLLLALALVAIILVQRSEGGGLGIGGGGGMSGFMTSRGTANFLTRTTAILATCFICTSLLLAYLGKRDNQPTSILEAGETPDLDALELPSLGIDGTDSGQDTGSDGTSREITEPTQPGVPLD